MSEARATASNRSSRELEARLLIGLGREVQVAYQIENPYRECCFASNNPAERV